MANYFEMVNVVNNSEMSSLVNIFEGRVLVNYYEMLNVANKSEGLNLGNKFPIEVNILMDNFGGLGNKFPFERNVLMNNSGGGSFVGYCRDKNLGET